MSAGGEDLSDAWKRAATLQRLTDEIAAVVARARETGIDDETILAHLQDAADALRQVTDMIVQARKPKRRTKAQAYAAPLPIASIVTAKKPEPRRRASEEIDPEVAAEVDAEVRAWVLKKMRPLSR